MSDNTNKAFEQAAAFQKLWMDAFSKMAGAWTELSPASPPPDELRKLRGSMLKALAETWDDFMRTPQFMEMMKTSLNGALDLKRMAREGLSWMHGQFETPDKEDLDGVLLAIRHVERRILDRLEGMDERIALLDDRLRDIEHSSRRPAATATAKKPRKTTKS